MGFGLENGLESERWNCNLVIKVVSLFNINIARVMRAKFMAKKLQGTVKEVLGTAFAIGCTLNGVSPGEIQKGIDAGTITIPAE